MKSFLVQLEKVLKSLRKFEYFDPSKWIIQLPTQIQLSKGVKSKILINLDNKLYRWRDTIGFTLFNDIYLCHYQN
ncbi:unnamed protein product [Paramecium sonneborni]|uniref:Uncharacterized protein n=1 Tax=Paramecium sonneborni TaxID=65129 RepID=A0A8S1RPT0_9CILI|nr:unnamed protein product [Paramecium sonneborni]